MVKKFENVQKSNALVSDNSSSVSLKDNSSVSGDTVSNDVSSKSISSKKVSSKNSFSKNSSSKNSFSKNSSSKNSSSKNSSSNRFVFSSFHWKLIFVLLFFMVIFGLAIVMFFDFNYYKESFVVNGVVFKSNEVSSASFFSDYLPLDNNIYLSPIFVVNDVSDIQVNALNLWTVALTAKNYNVVQLLRSSPDGVSVSSCLTNFGDLKTNVEISALDCKNYFDSDFFIVRIEHPDSSLVNGFVELKKNQIIIRPSNEIEATTLSYGVLKSLFSDLDSILGSANDIIDSIGG